MVTSNGSGHPDGGHDNKWRPGEPTELAPIGKTLEQCGRQDVGSIMSLNGFELRITFACIGNNEQSLTFSKGFN